MFWTARLSGVLVGLRRRLGMISLTLGAALVLMFVVRDHQFYDRILAEQDATAGRVPSAIQVGAPPSASDLARIGGDLLTAKADTAMIRTVRAIDGIDARSRRDDEAEGERH